MRSGSRVSGGGRLAIRQSDRRRGAVTTEGQATHKRHRLHSRNFLNSIHNLAMKAPLGCDLFVLGSWQTVFQAEKLLWFETQVDPQQLVKTSDQQTGADQ